MNTKEICFSIYMSIPRQHLHFFLIYLTNKTNAEVKKDTERKLRLCKPNFLFYYSHRSIIQSLVLFFGNDYYITDTVKNFILLSDGKHGVD